MSKESYEQSLLHNFTLFKYMTAGEKRIACTFTIMYRAFMCKNQKHSFWGREKIAKHSKCSIGQVSRFTTKYKGFIFEDVRQPKKQSLEGKVKYSSNRYKFNHHFFTMLWFLKKRGYVKYWHVHSEKLYTQITENEDIAKKKLGYDFALINKQCAHDDRLKAHTRVSRDSSNRLDMVPTKELSVPHIKFPQKTASEIIRVHGLSNSCKAHLDRFGSIYLVQEINHDYDFSTKHGKKIRYPDRWVKSRLLAQMQQQYKILNSKRL